MFQCLCNNILGYANEVGEAFRPFIGSRWVKFSYAVATAYVIADAVDKTVIAYKVSAYFLSDLFRLVDQLLPAALHAD